MRLDRKEYFHVVQRIPDLLRVVTLVKTISLEVFSEIYSVPTALEVFLHSPIACAGR